MVRIEVVVMSVAGLGHTDQKSAGSVVKTVELAVDLLFSVEKDGAAGSAREVVCLPVFREPAAVKTAFREKIVCLRVSAGIGDRNKSCLHAESVRIKIVDLSVDRLPPFQGKSVCRIEVVGVSVDGLKTGKILSCGRIVVAVVISDCFPARFSAIFRAFRIDFDAFPSGERLICPKRSLLPAKDHSGDDAQRQDGDIQIPLFLHQDRSPFVIPNTNYFRDLP